MKIMVCCSTLLKYAKELAAAEKTGNPDLIAVAKKRHDDYVALCKEADGMMLNTIRSTVNF